MDLLHGIQIVNSHYHYALYKNENK